MLCRKKGSSGEGVKSAKIDYNINGRFIKISMRELYMSKYLKDLRGLAKLNWGKIF